MWTNLLRQKSHVRVTYDLTRLVHISLHETTEVPNVGHMTKLQSSFFAELHA